jgi:hypothetical protein
MADPRGINPPIDAGIMTPEEKKQLVDTACPVDGPGTMANRMMAGDGIIGGGVGLVAGAAVGGVAALLGVKEQSENCARNKSNRIERDAKFLKLQHRGFATARDHISASNFVYPMASTKTFGDLKADAVKADAAKACPPEPQDRTLSQNKETINANVSREFLLYAGAGAAAGLLSEGPPGAVAGAIAGGVVGIVIGEVKGTHQINEEHKKVSAGKAASKTCVAGYIKGAGGPPM